MYVVLYYPGLLLDKGELRNMVNTDQREFLILEGHSENSDMLKRGNNQKEIMLASSVSKNDISPKNVPRFPLIN